MTPIGIWSRVKAKKKTDADVEKYFRGLSEKYADKPGTRSKVIFALAGYTYGRDRQKAVRKAPAEAGARCQYRGELVLGAYCRFAKLFAFALGKP